MDRGLHLLKRKIHPGKILAQGPAHRRRQELLRRARCRPEAKCAPLSDEGKDGRRGRMHEVIVESERGRGAGCPQG